MSLANGTYQAAVRLIAAAILLAIGAGFFGIHVAKSLARTGNTHRARPFPAERGIPSRS
jgi:hypothetical protein